MVIQIMSCEAVRSVGGENTIQKLMEMGTMLKKIQGRRRPQRVFVLSDKKPANGSEMASQTRDAPKMKPITAADMPSTSVENFKRYSETKQNI